jgi:hypothetical protein
MASSEDGSVEKPINREPDSGKLTERYVMPRPPLRIREPLAFEEGTIWVAL